MTRAAAIGVRAAGALWLAAFIGIATTERPAAYPEFQAFAQKQSGRQVNCAMCHANPDGPNGVKPGQIGGLSTADLDRLAQARQAFEPGVVVNSPILNTFGNDIIRRIGRTAFIGLRRQPAGLASALGRDGDLDQDGISDAQEFLDGTDPLDAQSGDPWKLFTRNLARSRFHILMLGLATLAGLYGLNHLLRWFAAAAPSSGRP